MVQLHDDQSNDIARTKAPQPVLMAISWRDHLFLSLLCGGIGCLAVLVIPCRSMHFLWRAQPGHSRSFGIYVIDPGGNPTEEESYILWVPLREMKQEIDDEEILARFSRGFFAGWVFGPERWIAPFVQGIIDHEVFTNARASTGDSCSRLDAYERDISRPNAMSQQRLRLSAHAYSAYTTSLTQAFAALNIEHQYTLRQLKDPGQSGVSWNTQAARKAGALRRLTGSS
ncbi:hypothetical protein BDW67DRAFT_183515 [Aspergillus spinulosporus]